MAKRSRAAFVLALALGLGCTSPTLPLPPPTAPTITAGSTPDTVKLDGTSAEPNAVIIVVNRNNDLPRDKRVSGTIADEAGTWDVEVVAKTGDALDIAQDNGSVRSPVTTVTVR
jgi:hypothetical protein